MTHKIQQAHHFPEIGVPFFWPFGIALDMEEKALKLEQKNMDFLEEVVKTEQEKPKPTWASPNVPLYSLHTFTLRDFSAKKFKHEVPVFILPPYAGHTSVIADFHKKQSLVETLLKNDIKRVVLTD